MKHFPVLFTFIVAVNACVCRFISSLSVCFELIGAFYSRGCGLCWSVRFVFTDKFVGVVLVFHYFSCLSIYCIFEEMRLRYRLFIYPCL
jgi:hypothetical protein